MESHAPDTLHSTRQSRTLLPWGRLSIRTKIPLAGALLIAVAALAVTGAGYFRVRAFVIGAASERLFVAATQVSELLGRAVEQRVGTFRQAAMAPVIAEVIAGKTDQLPMLRNLLVKLAGADGAAHVGVFDRDGRLLAASGGSPALPEPSALTSLNDGRDAYHMTPLQRDDTQLFYVLTVGVYDDDGLIGYLAERHRAGGSSAATGVIGNLIGGQARLTFGNAAGDIWTEFPLPALTDADLGAGAPVIEANAGEPVFVRVARIPGTPLVSAVAFPIAPVMQPVRRFLVEALGITLVIVAIGAVTAWFASIRITTPLQKLAHSVESLARNEPAAPLDLNRADELGSLAVSFNRMTERVTEGRLALEQMVQSLEQRVNARTAALESANRELEAFSYSVSHDLRAPLRAVTGFSQILLEDHAPALNADARQCVETIARRAQHMGRLIDDLLAFSRLGRTMIGRDTVDMNRLVHGVVDEARRANPGREIAWEIQPLPPAVGESPLIQQVLSNLVQNAVKFTRNSRDAAIGIGIATTPRGPAYFVRDTGVGFDMKYADRLFGVFQRLHRQDEFEGTGVGLAIVQRIVDRHGGQVWAEAAIGEGATFYFTLPSAAMGEAA